MNICSHCHVWRCHPKDRFCGHCGENLLDAAILIQPMSNIYQGSVVPDRVETVIRNARGGLGGTSFFWRNAAGTEVPIVHLEKQELNQHNEQQTYVTSSSDLALEPMLPMEWSIIHRVAPEKEICRATLSCGLPTPSLVLDKSEIKFPSLDEPQAIELVLKHQSGGPAVIENIIVTAHEEATALNLPVVDQTLFPLTLSQGEEQQLSLPMTEELWRVLQGHAQGLSVSLEIQVKYISSAIILPLKLGLPIPARPILKLPERVRTLQGRVLRLPFKIENLGGNSCQLSAMQVDIRLGRKEICSYNHKLAHSYNLEGGEVYSTSIEHPLIDEQEQPLDSGLYHCTVKQILVDEELEYPTETIELEIRSSEQDYQGIIAIDFGTSASAVAYYHKGNRQSPNSLQLSSQDDYIPTAIAYYLDEQDQLQYCIGHDALAMLDTEHSSDIVYLDNLKWRLTNPEPILLPDGTEHSWQEIAVDYLKQIKNLIEDDMNIVSNVKTVVITKPSRFHPLLTEALHSVYKQAGLETLAISLGNNQDYTSLAESWPPLLSSLPLPNLKDFQDKAVGYQMLGEGDQFLGKHAVITYDVGGGSTDISLFLLDIENFAKMQITELATDGTGIDDYFFGNGFSDLLFKYIWPSCERWLSRQGYDIKQFPISLPWQPVHIGAEQKIARENGRRCADFVLEYFQSSEGPFENMNLTFRNISDWDRPDNEELENLQDELQDTCNSSVAQAKLKLQSLFGEDVEVPGGTDGVYLDFISFINDFIKSCSIPMFERLQHLLQDSQLNDLNIYLLATGRGSFFPLVGSMLFAHQARINSNNQSQKIEQVRVDRGYAKTIVSLGACHLASLPQIAQGIVFIPRTMPSFGVQGDLDPDTGMPQFIPLCAGIPRSADGWQVAAYPLRASNSQSFYFYFSADNKNTITDNDEHFGTVSGNINIDSTQTASAHIMIKAKKDNAIEVYIGFPTEDQIHGKDYEDWERELVGELTFS